MNARMTRLPRARNENLLMEELPDGKMLFDTARNIAHSLNPTAALVWQQCDGQTTIEQMDAQLRQHDLPAGEEVVCLALDRLAKAHLLEEPFTAPVAGLSRRALIRKLGMAAGMTALIPVVTSVVAPTPAMATTAHGGSSSQPNSSHLTIVGYGGEATIHVGQCVALSFQVRFVGSEAYLDESQSPNTSYTSVPGHAFGANEFCADAGDVGKEFTIYATYRDPKTGVQTTSTAKVNVVP